MKSLIKFHTDSAINIQRIANILEQNQIPSMTKSNAESGRLAGFGTIDNSVDLYIDASNIEKAKELLEGF